MSSQNKTSSAKITRLSLTKFTGFEQLDWRPSPGLNVLIGENGTGKTHLLKVLYAAITYSLGSQPRLFSEKLVSVFRPADNGLGRLAKRGPGVASCTIRVFRGSQRISLNFSTKSVDPKEIKEKPKDWTTDIPKCTFIPVKEMLAHAEGFSSIYYTANLPFEETYVDIIQRALLPPPLGPPDKIRKNLMNILEKSMAGSVEVRGEKFFLKDKNGRLEFPLVAEGLRKLALVWKLVQNGQLADNAILFWDEPEANLNPKLVETVAEILLQLQREGVQIFAATHSYILAKELEVQKTDKDKLQYHWFFKETVHLEKKEAPSLSVRSSGSLADLTGNPISSAYSSVLEKELERIIGS